MILPGSYANGFAPRDGRPLYPESWRGCVGAWAQCLGPTGLTLRDWSGFAKHGSLTGGPSFAVSQGRYATNHIGTGAITLPTNYGHGASDNPFSWSFWFRYSGAGNQQILGRFDGSALFQIHVSDLAGRNLRVGAGTGGFSSGITASTSANTWYHGAFTLDSSRLGTVYLNGVAGGSFTPSAFTSATALQIGQRGGDSAEILTGLVDDLRVYNRVLSNAEILLLAKRRGIAYELAPCRRSSVQVAAFNRRRRLLIGASS